MSDRSYMSRRPVRSSVPPATMGILIAVAVCGLLHFVSPVAEGWLAFDSLHSVPLPWSLLTGSFLTGGDIMGLFFGALWFYWVGSSLERALGTKAFLVLWVIISVSTGLGLWACAMLIHASGPLSFILIIPALTLIWGLINPNVMLLLFGIVPTSGATMAWGAPLLFFAFYAASWGLAPALFGLTGCLVAWAYVRWPRIVRSLGLSRRRQPRFRIPARRGWFHRRRKPADDRGLIVDMGTRTRDKRIERLFDDADEQNK